MRIVRGLSIFISLVVLVFFGSARAMSLGGVDYVYSSGNSVMAGRYGGVNYPTMLELSYVEREFVDWIYDANGVATSYVYNDTLEHTVWTPDVLGLSQLHGEGRYSMEGYVQSNFSELYSVIETRSFIPVSPERATAYAQSRDTIIFRSKSGAELLDVEVKVQFTQRYYDNGALNSVADGYSRVVLAVGEPYGINVPWSSAPFLHFQWYATESVVRPERSYIRTASIGDRDDAFDLLSSFSACTSENLDAVCGGVGYYSAKVQVPTNVPIALYRDLQLTASNGDKIALGNKVFIRELVESDGLIIESSSGFNYKQVSSVPEPSAFSMMGIGVLFLFFRVWRHSHMRIVHRRDS